MPLDNLLEGKTQGTALYYGASDDETQLDLQHVGAQPAAFPTRNEITATTNLATPARMRVNHLLPISQRIQKLIDDDDGEDTEPEVVAPGPTPGPTGSQSRAAKKAGFPKISVTKNGVTTYPFLAMEEDSKDFALLSLMSIHRVYAVNYGSKGEAWDKVLDGLRKYKAGSSQSLLFENGIANKRAITDRANKLMAFAEQHRNKACLRSGCDDEIHNEIVQLLDNLLELKESTEKAEAEVNHNKKEKDTRRTQQAEILRVSSMNTREGRKKMAESGNRDIPDSASKKKSLPSSSESQNFLQIPEIIDIENRFQDANNIRQGKIDLFKEEAESRRVARDARIKRKEERDRREADRKEERDRREFTLKKQRLEIAAQQAGLATAPGGNAQVKSALAVLIDEQRKLSNILEKLIDKIDTKL